MNMKKEYRAELKQLRKAERKLWRDLKAYSRESKRQEKRIIADRLRAKGRTCAENGRLLKRIRILEGRLG